MLVVNPSFAVNSLNESAFILTKGKQKNNSTADYFARLVVMEIPHRCAG